MGSVAPGHLVWGTSWYLFRTTSEPASWQLGYHVHTSAHDRGASGKQQRIHKWQVNKKEGKKGILSCV